MPLYFAYGANLDSAEVRKRCPRSKSLGVAQLKRHRLVVMREGWLTVVRDARADVHGVLWDLALSDIPALDRFEQVGSGLYAKITQPVVAAGGPKRALVYVGANAGPGRVHPDYIATVLESARTWPLPRDGLAELERLAREAGVKTGAEAPVKTFQVRPRFASPLDRG